MKLSTRFSGILSICALTASMFLAGCGPNTTAVAPQSSAAPQTSAAAPQSSDFSGQTSNLPPQVVELGCPVQSDYEMQQIFRGYYGVDGYNRPVNAHDVPVDTNGNCLSTAPVPEVFSAAVAPAYINVLYLRYGYRYSYQPGYVHVIVVPGSIYRRNVVPTGHVIIQTVRPAGTTVTVPVGNTRTVRPGAPAPATTVAPGAASTVRPGAPSSAPQVATPSSVTPPKAALPTSTFNRPGQAPSVAPAPAPVPASVTPPHAAAPTSTFNRPTAAPASVTPPRAAAPTKTFVRPGHK